MDNHRSRNQPPHRLEPQAVLPTRFQLKHCMKCIRHTRNPSSKKQLERFDVGNCHGHTCDVGALLTVHEHRMLGASLPESAPQNSVQVSATGMCQFPCVSQTLSSGSNYEQEPTNYCFWRDLSSDLGSARSYQVMPRIYCHKCFRSRYQRFLRDL